MEPQDQQTLLDLIPDDWSSDRVRSLWIATYRGAVPPDAITPPRTLLIDCVQVVLLHGTLSYQAVEVVGHPLDGPIEVKPQARQTPRGSYTLLATPFDTADATGDEAPVRQAISATLGLATAINGGALALDFVYENIIDLEREQVTAFGPVMSSPAAFGPAQVGETDFNLLESASKAISDQPDNIARRIRLALHWFEQSLRDHGRDEFIKLWVALEALAMPDTTNVWPLNRLLAASYGIQESEAASRFGVGKLQGLRSRVLHNGEPLPIHADLANYTRAVFVDALLAMLALAGQGRAESYARSPQFESPFNLDRLAHIGP